MIIILLLVGGIDITLMVVVGIGMTVLVIIYLLGLMLLIIQVLRYEWSGVRWGQTLNLAAVGLESEPITKLACVALARMKDIGVNLGLMPHTVIG